MDKRGLLCWAILFKGLEHPWILVPMQFLEPPPCRHWEGAEQGKGSPDCPTAPLLLLSCVRKNEAT